MLIIEKLEIGDSLNFAPKKGDELGQVLKLFGKYSHTSTVSKIDYKLKKVFHIESHAKSGVEELEVEEKYYPQIDVRRIIGGLSSTDKFLYMEWMRSKIGCNYAFRDYKGIIKGLLFGGREKPYPDNIPDEFYCTELHATGLLYLFDLWAVKGVHPTKIIPSDLSWANSNERLIC